MTDLLDLAGKATQPLKAGHFLDLIEQRLFMLNSMLMAIEQVMQISATVYHIVHHLDEDVYDDHNWYDE